MKKFLLSLFSISSILASIAQNATLTPLLELDNAAITCISENGEWACGAAFNNNDNAGYESNASKWNLLTGERIYLVANDEIDNAQANAFAITNDGSLVVGQYLFQPAYYINGEWHVLELPQGYTVGEARDVAIVNGDTIIAGRIFDSTGYQKVEAVTWTNGQLNKLNNIIPREYQYDEDKKMATQLTGISEDGRVMLGAYDPFAWPLRTPFIIKDGEFKLLSISDRPEFANYHNGIDFFKEEKLSHNGKYITFSFFGHNSHIPCIYDIENDEFRIITEAPAETGGKAVDDAGNIYYAGPMTTGFERKSYVSINQKAKQIDSILLENFGISQAQIDATCSDPDLTGSIRFVYDVSADGKTLIGSAGYGIGGYNWVLKLKYTLFDEVPDDVNNISYNPLAAFYSNEQINILGKAEYAEIYDINGNLLLSQKLTIPTIKASLINGIYIIKLYNGNSITTNKIIVK